MDKKHILLVQNPTPKRVEFAAVGATYVIDPMTGENPQKIVFQEETHMEDFLTRFKDPAYSFLTILDEAGGGDDTAGAETESELEGMTAELEATKTRLTEAEAKLEAANAEIQRLQEDLEAMQNDHSETNAKLGAALKEVEALKATRKKHKK